MQAEQELERYAADIRYFDRHRTELAEQYPEQWVAVYNRRVVGAAKGLKRLLKELETRGIPKGRAFIEYANESEDLLIL